MGGRNAKSSLFSRLKSTSEYKNRNTARFLLRKTNRKEIFEKLMPKNSEYTRKFLKFFEKLDAVRSLYRNPKPSTEEIEGMPAVCKNLEDFMVQELPWVPITSVLHNILHHTPKFFDHPWCPSNLLCLSSSAVELGNKELRKALRCHTFVSSLTRALSDSLKYSYYR